MNTGLTERQAIEELRRRGFRDDLRLEPEGVRHAATGRVLDPATVEIVTVRRTEGDSDTDAGSAVLGVRTDDGVQGVIVTAFGPGVPPELGEHLRAMKRARTSGPPTD